MKTTSHFRLRVALGTAALLPLVCLFVFLAKEGGPYFYCLARESSWLAARTETELDGRMVVFYSKRQIIPAESMWGNRYQLRPGERMIQYLVLYKEPFDVVFDGQGHVVTAFTSYE